MRLVRPLLAASAIVAASFSSASAQTASRIGTLDCAVDGSIGMIIGSNRGVTCYFLDRNGRRVETYVGNIAKLGLDVGVTQRARMVWGVIADTRRPGRGALAGNYTGASADASVGVGGGAKLLVGGSGSTISLQPLSVQGQTGVNLAVGVENLTLTPAARR